jgi:hypothetical protein
MWRSFLSRVLILLPAALALVLASCSQYGFLDDFPVYPPTQPYLDNQALVAKRLEAQRMERERREREADQRTSEEKVREWEQLQERTQRELSALSELRARRTHDRTNPHTKAEDLAEWRRIVGR